MLAELKACRIPVDQRVLIVGGSAADEQLLRQVGFQDIINSTLPTDMDRMNGEEANPGTERIALDVEQMDLPSDSYDLVFASEVLHHCSSPHHALCEMLRVSRRYVIFMEPDDSVAMNALVKMNFSFPYELPAAIAHDYQFGRASRLQYPEFHLPLEPARGGQDCLFLYSGTSLFRARGSLLGFQRDQRRTGSEKSHSHWQHHVGHWHGQFRRAAAGCAIISERDPTSSRSG